MTKVPYSKPALSFAEQLSQLKERGLIFENDAKALHLLQVISYFRLSGYWFPLLADKQNHAFKPGSLFETAFDIYKFDRELRLLILRELEKIEVAVRSVMINTLSISRGAFWYVDVSNFSFPAKHATTLAKIREEHKRSDEEFIQSYNNKYVDSLPPSWMILEVSSFGILSSLYSNLVPGKDKREIAAFFGLSDKALASWLHSIVYLRNICAHHSRLWNREMRIQPIIPRNPHHPFLNTTAYQHPDLNRLMPLNNKAYFILSMVLYLMNTINPKHSIHSRFFALLEKYPNIDTRAMGFPAHWDNEPLWHKK
jgi:abortive infection bacteriophage resistance protein